VQYVIGAIGALHAKMEWNGKATYASRFCHFPQHAGTTSTVVVCALVTPPPLSCPLFRRPRTLLLQLSDAPTRKTPRARAFLLAASDRACVNACVSLGPGAVQRRCMAHGLLLGQSLAPQLPTNLPNPESLLLIVLFLDERWLAYWLPICRRGAGETPRSNRAQQLSSLLTDRSPHEGHQQRCDVTRQLVSMTTCGSFILNHLA
jgi:hypothetical protein